MRDYAAAQTDDGYRAVVRCITDAELFVVRNPKDDGAGPIGIVNGRGENIALAFTDRERVGALYAGTAVRVSPMRGSALLGLLGDAVDALVIDPKHPTSFAVTPGWVRSGEPEAQA